MMRDYRLKYYLLNEDHSLREVDMETWAHEFGRMDRGVAWTGNDAKHVSTVFLGLDHRFFGDGPPLVFETMAFVHEGRTMDFGNGPEPVPETLAQERYSSWDDAQIGHEALVRKYLVNPKTRVKAQE
jgi:hypothetical protein